MPTYVRYFFWLFNYVSQGDGNDSFFKVHFIFSGKNESQMFFNYLENLDAFRYENPVEKYVCLQLQSF